MKLPDNLTVVLFVNALDDKTKLFPSPDGTDIVTFAFRAYSKAKQLKGGRMSTVSLYIEHPEPHRPYLNGPIWYIAAQTPALCVDFS